MMLFSGKKKIKELTQLNCEQQKEIDRMKLEQQIYAYDNQQNINQLRQAQERYEQIKATNERLHNVIDALGEQQLKKDNEEDSNARKEYERLTTDLAKYCKEQQYDFGSDDTSQHFDARLGSQWLENTFEAHRPIDVYSPANASAGFGYTKDRTWRDMCAIQQVFRERMIPLVIFQPQLLLFWQRNVVFQNIVSLIASTLTNNLIYNRKYCGVNDYVCDEIIVNENNRYVNKAIEYAEALGGCYVILHPQYGLFCVPPDDVRRLKTDNGAVTEEIMTESENLYLSLPMKRKKECRKYIIRNMFEGEDGKDGENEFVITDSFVVFCKGSNEKKYNLAKNCYRGKADTIIESRFDVITTATYYLEKVQHDLRTMNGKWWGKKDTKANASARSSFQGGLPTGRERVEDNADTHGFCRLPSINFGGILEDISIEQLDATPSIKSSLQMVTYLIYTTILGFQASDLSNVDALNQVTSSKSKMTNFEGLLYNKIKNKYYIYYQSILNILDLCSVYQGQSTDLYQISFKISDTSLERAVNLANTTAFQDNVGAKRKIEGNVFG